MSLFAWNALYVICGLGWAAIWSAALPEASLGRKLAGILGCTFVWATLLIALRLIVEVVS